MIIMWEIGAIQPLWLYGGNVWNYVSGDGGSEPPIPGSVDPTLSGGAMLRNPGKLGLG